MPLSTTEATSYSRPATAYFALFGAPVAHEDHPQRALFAALRLLDQLKRYSDTLRGKGLFPLQERVGLNTGEVVGRSLRTGEDHVETTPIGHAISLAANAGVNAGRIIKN